MHRIDPSAARIGATKETAMLMAVVYSLMAIIFGSYIQPLIIMIAIPFGIVGAVIGHILLD